METGSRKNFLELLPVELQAQILALLPDIGTLRTAVLSCPAFFHAFRYSEGPIMNSVLLGEIGSAVFPEAVIALEASSIRHGKPTVQERANSVSQKQLLRREQVQWIWTPADALAASKVHFYVHSFATKFASAALSRVPSCSGLQLEHSPSTQQELERIERALYRFEIYCNLFPPSRSMESEIASGDSAAMQYEAFFSRFAPWENEQLACIYDFLVREVSPAFNNIALHDIAWGEFSVEYAHQIDDYHIQRLLADGLRRLYDIATANTYEARYKLLGCTVPKSVESFLYESLLDCANQIDDTARPEEYQEERELTRILRPFFDDPDAGPETAWRWAHRRDFPTNIINQEGSRPLRAWGYVFWNLERLNASSVLQNEWKEPDNWDDYTEIYPSLAEMTKSWDVRSELYNKGRRGYWC